MLICYTYLDKNNINLILYVYYAHIKLNLMSLSSIILTVEFLHMY